MPIWVKRRDSCLNLCALSSQCVTASFLSPVGQLYVPQTTRMPGIIRQQKPFHKLTLSLSEQQYRMQPIDILRQWW